MYKLDDFIKDTQTNQFDARNFMSFLIGYSFNNENAVNAILKYYENVPELWKEDKKAFSDIFFKFFKKYKINDENIKYYNDFSPLWTVTNREEIKNLNPDFFNKSIEEYKNSNEFCKSLLVINRKEFSNPGVTYDFIERNSDNIYKLLRKDRNKFFENLKKYKLELTLISTDHSKFDDFCKKYKVNPCELIESAFLKHEGFQAFKNISDDTLIYCFNELDKNHLPWKKREDLFFWGIMNNSKSKYETLDKFFISCLLVGKYKSADFVLNNYHEHLFTLMQKYIDDALCDDKKQSTYSEQELLEKTMSHIYEIKRSNKRNYMYDNLISPRETIQNINSFISHHYLNKKLPNDSLNLTKQRNKI